MKHTPSPWKVIKPRKDLRTMFGGDTGIEILSELKNSDGICGGYQTVVGFENCQHDRRILSEADARFIVTACNCHDELLEALQAIMKCNHELGAISKPIADQARTAIANATKE